MPNLHTIGHSVKPFAQFCDELRAFNIYYVVDVRSYPHSQHASDYDSPGLSHKLRAEGFNYVWLGDTLGGKPHRRDYYGPDGKPDYAKMATNRYFREGIQRLLEADQKGIRLALMCAEARPEVCHRARLIGEQLLAAGVDCLHIYRNERKGLTSAPQSKIRELFITQTKTLFA